VPIARHDRLLHSGFAMQRRIPMIPFRASSAAMAVAGASAITSIATPAMADWGHRWHRPWWGWRARAHYCGLPMDYVSPRVVYAPPPPSPMYYSPGVSYGVTI
jgi:hypothetical protein